MSNKNQNIATKEADAGRICAEADRWLTKISDGPLSPDDARAFNAWLAADPSHERQFRIGQTALREISLMRGEPDIDELMRPSFYEKLNSASYEAIQWLKHKIRSEYIWAAFGTAATAAAAFAVVLVLATQDNHTPEQTAETQEPLYATKVAEIRSVTLPDGSVVTLGGASSLGVDFSSIERRVTLSNGEAFFDIQKDSSRPFIVAADNTLVRVLGTKFDVNLGTKAVDVAVLEGRVEVIRPKAYSETIRDEDIKHVLTAGQKVAAAKSGPVRPVEAVEAEDVAAWRRGELIWVDKPVRDIIADLNRYSSAKIIMEDRTIGDLDYTLALKADDLPRGVRLLAASLGLEATERTNGDIVLQ